MQDLIAHAPQLLALAGTYWMYALIAAFVAMTFESAKPKLADGEPESEGALARNLVMAASLLTPFLLLAHAFWAMAQAQRPDALLVAFAAVLGAVLVASLLGTVIGAVAPGLGRVLRRISPFLSAAVLAFTLYVTWSNVNAVLQLYVLSRLG